MRPFEPPIYLPYVDIFVSNIKPLLRSHSRPPVCAALYARQESAEATSMLHTPRYTHKQDSAACVERATKFRFFLFIKVGPTSQILHSQQKRHVVQLYFATEYIGVHGWAFILQNHIIPINAMLMSVVSFVCCEVRIYMLHFNVRRPHNPIANAIYTSSPMHDMHLRRYRIANVGLNPSIIHDTLLRVTISSSVP